MSPLVLAILIVSVLGDDSAESGEQLQHHCTHIFREISFIQIQIYAKNLNRLFSSPALTPTN